MTEKLWFGEWINSGYYKKLYSRQGWDEGPEFIRDLVQKLTLPADSRAIDLACGVGSMTTVLASFGFDTTGTDVSAANIAEAKKLEHEKLHFFLHDLRLPFWVNYFDLGLNLFNRFGHYHTRREHDNAIRTIAKGLKPGGLLVIDILNIHFSENDLVSEEKLTIDQTEFSIRRWDDESYFYKRITVAESSLTEPAIFTEKLTKFSLGDLTDMLSFQGMQIQQVYGDYDFRDYDTRKTPRMIIIAKKEAMKQEDKEKRIYSDGRKTDALT